MWRNFRASQPAGLQAPGVALAQSPAPQRAVQPRGDLSAAEQTTVEIFRRSAPSVVYITTLSVRENPFRRNVLEIPRGTGSGFIWDQKGHVVTNFHVLQGANAARVTLDDQSTWPASLVGYAADKDLAVLRIEAPAAKLQPLQIGASNNLVVGQHVFAIGNPFGFDHTLSTGVISGLNREIMSASNRPIQNVVQTDAAINPGNSGGPLLDSAGRLIGVNTAIFSPSGAYAGIGFAVPVDTVRRIVPELITHGKVMRPGIGIEIADQTLAERLGIKGVLVLGIIAGSPAERVGLRPVRRDAQTGALVIGDVITSIDAEAVDDTNDLYRLLDRRQVGQSVKLGIRRAQQKLSLPLKLVAIDE